MATRGRKPKNERLKAVAGTTRPDRMTEPVFEEQDGAASLPPAFQDLRLDKPLFAEKVLEVWNRKLARYQLRNQATADYEDLLFVICLFEAQIQEKPRLGQLVTAADLNALRVAHGAFYDTPTANVRPANGRCPNPFSPNGRPTENPFARNVRWPTPPQDG